ncbi:hypothetical protein V6Z11_D06G246600 [Gossypium hirsutum]|uniref:Transcriptional corepressor LEUNIG isoform X1 n=2 Tax=Gossypium hirsutum TaxID=3635 RepID=A0ABM3ABK5_GOSHI|nr:transcriptional corepressor LEUNIG-like isoform X1 [Gossypium hirsutum]XP_040952247.1 transcriptional corepressor LEUNIG-like isoform X1 [Gossypium hirsutum]XP_040952248.1 transcriptional corepressor LEUNIG-like isoform X1 [Gossypium hirsutum]XP_040952249.1 transcriptional corepressor LEUNIG-like isoform X1 [Gossypium hirsutum]
MAGGDDPNHEKLLELYLHDFFMKNDMRETAEIFRQEGNVPNNPVPFDYNSSQGQGFLKQWCEPFYKLLTPGPPILQANSEAEISDPAAQNVRTKKKKTSMMNQQWTGQTYFPTFTDFCSGSAFQSHAEDNQMRPPFSSFLPPQINLDQDVEMSEGQSTNFPINPTTFQWEQNLQLPVTATRHHGEGPRESIEPPPVNTTGHHGEGPGELIEPPPVNILHIIGNKPSTSYFSGERENNGFSLVGVGCLPFKRKKETFCSHFSSDGKFLATAGPEKVAFWHMKHRSKIGSKTGHSLPITDVRFVPNSHVVATSSYDKTVLIWEDPKTGRPPVRLEEHINQVLSLDFHPKRENLLCSSDGIDEIRFWDINRGSCIHIFQGASKQVRFQPLFGRFLATCSDNVVNLIDVETSKICARFEGHENEVQSICWDPNGIYIASISEDSARLWSVFEHNCLHELHATDNKFQCCTFHPKYWLHWVIGAEQSLELWNPLDTNKTWKFEAHMDAVSSLASSLDTEMIASTSHDELIKLWK